MFNLDPVYIKRGDNNNTKLCSVGSAKTLAEAGFEDYKQARVEKLRELYEQYTPEVIHKWVLPKGVTDGRKALRIEIIVGEDISPFDLPDFKEQMPKEIDYIEQYIE